MHIPTIPSTNAANTCTGATTRYNLLHGNHTKGEDRQHEHQKHRWTRVDRQRDLCGQSQRVCYLGTDQRAILEQQGIADFKIIYGQRNCDRCIQLHCTDEMEGTRSMSELPNDIAQVLERVKLGLEHDERYAQYAVAPRWKPDWKVNPPVVCLADEPNAVINGPQHVLNHVARQDPARVLRQVAAIRNMLASVDALRDQGFLGAGRIADDIIRALDEIYDDI
jgi:hypothetical protein